MKNHLVIIGLVIPEPDSTAAGFRMMQLIGLFKEYNYQITFLTASSNVEFSEKMEIQKIEINDSAFDAHIKKLNPDVVLFDRFITEEQFGWRISEQCPNALKILDTEDLHFLREARKTAFKERREVRKEDYFNAIFTREIAAILRCDVSLIISEFEYQLLIEKFKISPEILFYLPFLHSDKAASLNDFEKRKNYVSIGNFLHEPNWQTVLRLKTIWKNIHKQLPESELHVYGAYASEKVYQLENKKEGFLIKGRAANVAKTLNEYRVLLAPIPFGAGLKGKLFESMKFGIPNVTSSIGAEGMRKDKEWNGFIEDDEDLFAKESVRLYSDLKTWKMAQQNGFRILETLFRKELFDLNFQQRICELKSHLKTHRQSNFLGQILLHHHLNSTKYMSKWIEAKNRK